MRRTLVTSLLLSLLMAFGAAAQVDEGPDSFGLYFDVGGTYVNSTTVPINTLVPTYIVLAGPSRATLGGWEASFSFTPGSGAITGTTLAGDPINIATPPGFIVGFTTPLPVSGFQVLGTISFFSFGGLAEFFGGPSDPSSIEGLPSYVNGADLSDLVGCTFSTVVSGGDLDENGWTTVPLAVINGNAPVATEEVSWGSVKGLFR